MVWTQGNVKNRGWSKLDPELVKLWQQVNVAFPTRSRRSDGSIGDAAHSSRASDHNPNSRNIVHALDLTKDLSVGFDPSDLAEELRRTRDRRVKYMIHNGRIMSGNAGPSPWVWRKYNGSNPHTLHIHISSNGLTGGAWPVKNGLSGAEITVAQQYLVDTAFLVPARPGQRVVDGIMGPQTTAAVTAFQVAAGLTVDGIPGAQTLAALKLWAPMKSAAQAGSVIENRGQVLRAGEKLTRGQFLQSADGRHHVKLQSGDGHLVLYSTRGAVWSTGWKGDTFILQDDGNLVLYREGFPSWATYTYDGHALVMQDDGNLVLYTKDNVAVWHTQTHQVKP